MGLSHLGCWGSQARQNTITRGATSPTGGKGGSGRTSSDRQTQTLLWRLLRDLLAAKHVSLGIVIIDLQLKGPDYRDPAPRSPAQPGAAWRRKPATPYKERRTLKLLPISVAHCPSPDLFFLMRSQGAFERKTGAKFLQKETFAMPQTDASRPRNRGFLGPDSSALSSQDLQDRSQLRYELDLNSWNFRIWGVAASGFLTDSCVLQSKETLL